MRFGKWMITAALTCSLGLVLMGCEKEDYTQADGGLAPVTPASDVVQAPAANAETATNGATDAAAAAEGAVTNAAPAFSLPGIDGQTYSLADYKGKWVILEWTNPDCPFVMKHYDSGNMQSLQAKYGGRDDVMWMSVGSSSPGEQGHFSADGWKDVMNKKASKAEAMLMDPSGDVGRLYDAKTTPHMYVINPEGQLVYQGAIDSIKSARQSDIEKSENYVTTVMDAVLAGEPSPVSQTTAYGCSVKY